MLRDTLLSPAVRLFITSIAMTALAACGGGGSTSGATGGSGGSPTVPGSSTPTSTLTKIDISPFNQSIANRMTTQYTATGTYSNGTTQNITTSVVWGTGTPSVANINPQTGLATAVSSGTTTVTASSNGVSATPATLTVLPSSITLTGIQVTPANPTLSRAGKTQQFTALGTYSDSTVQDVTTSVSWVSSNSAVSTISNEAGFQGLATSVASGTSNITAVSGTVTSPAATLTVLAPVVKTLTLTPPSPVTAKNFSVQLVATATYADDTIENVTKSVTWSSANTAIATISDDSVTKGLAKGVAAGTATITATFLGKTSTAAVTVNNDTLWSATVSATGANASADLPKGLTRQYAATGSFTNANAAKTNPTNPTITSTQDVTNDVAWAIVDNASAPITTGEAGPVATVSNLAGTKGVVYARTSSGGAKISVTFPKTTYALNCSPDATTFAADQAYYSSAVAALMPTPSASAVTALNPQTGSQSFKCLVSQIAAGLDSASAAAAASPVSPVTSSVPAAIGSQIPSAAAKTTNATSAPATITVTTPVITQIQVGTLKSTAPVGTDVQYTAVGILSDNNKLSDIASAVSWTVFPDTCPPTGACAAMTDKSVPTGKYKFSSTGVAVITSTIADNGTVTVGGTAYNTLDKKKLTSNKDVLSVTPAILKSIAVEPILPSEAASGVVAASMIKDTTIQYTATGTYSDNTTQVLTKSVQWMSSQSGVATASNDPKGLIKGIDKGSTVISATDSATGTSGSAALRVLNCTINRLQIQNPDGSEAASGVVAVGAVTQPFKVTGTFGNDVSGNNDCKDGNKTQDLTKNNATWSSSKTNVATIESTTGTVRGAAVGDTSIGALFKNLAQSNTPAPVLSVKSLKQITISPVSGGASIAAGTTRRFKAVGSYQDGTTQDISAAVTWLSSNAGTASISNVAGTNGLAKGLLVGTSGITAALTPPGSDPIVSNSISLGITAAKLNSIVVTPVNPSVAKAATLQFVATGNYSDGTKQIVTSDPSISWVSSNPAVATIDTAGKATGVQTGSTNISATAAGIDDDNNPINVTGSQVLTVP